MNVALDQQLQSIVKSNFREHLIEPLGINEEDATRTEALVLNTIRSALCRHEILDMDAADQMREAVEASASRMMHSLATNHPDLPVSRILSFQTAVAESASDALETLRSQFICPPSDGALPASPLLAKGTRPVYEFVRKTLSIPMHGIENLKRFEGGFTELTIGHNVSTIYEVRTVCENSHVRCLTPNVQAIRNGQMQDVMANIFQNLEEASVE